MIQHTITTYSRRLRTHEFDSYFLILEQKASRGSFRHVCICRMQTDQSADESDDSEDISGNVVRMLTRDEKFSSRILQDKGAGVRRRWWRGWKGSGRVDACIDYLFSLLLARTKGRRNGKGCERERASSPTFEVHLPCLEEIRFLHTALLSLPTYSYSLPTLWEKVVLAHIFIVAKLSISSDLE